MVHIGEASDNSDTTGNETTSLSPLEQAIAVFSGDLGQRQAADAERMRRASIVQNERLRREMTIRQRQAEQAERTQRGMGTPPGEVDAGTAELCADFMQYIERARRETGRDPFALAAQLPMPQNSNAVMRGFFIGTTGEAPSDSGAIGRSSGLYLCEDGTLRTYRADRTKKGHPATQGIPLDANGEFEELHPGYFNAATIGRRRVATIENGRIVLPVGAESGSALYRIDVGKTQYQSQQVHPYREETLEESLAATAYFTIQEGRARPVYNRFDPDLDPPR